MSTAMTSTASSADARRRILDAAIQLVSLKGLSAITVRDVTAATGVNVAAVSYYFGSKEGLLQEVMLEVFNPVRTARSDALSLVLDRCAPEPPTLDAILAALIQPLVEAPRGPDGGRTVIRMMQHLKATPTHPISVFVSLHFDYGAQSFIDALARAMPGLARSELIWRYEFARGAAIHMLALCDPLSTKLDIISGGKREVDVDDNTLILQEIVQCALRGIGAPTAWKGIEPTASTAKASTSPRRRQRTGR